MKHFGQARRVFAALVLSIGAGAGFALAAAALAKSDATDRLASLKALYRRPSGVPFPPDNPYSEAKAELGRRLFFDPGLSGGGTLACAGCHAPELGFEDGVPLGQGETGERLERHTPTLWNLAWSPFLFWDGRAASLEDQLRFPIENPLEMNHPMADLVAHLAGQEGYRADFAGAFPDDPSVSEQNVLKALATFERTLVSPPGRFDRWVEGDADALTPQEVRGFLLFNGKAGCASCHSGWAFTDYAFHDTGLPDGDRGRGAVLGLPEADHAFKTPTLRDLPSRAPYMHDGSLATLEEVVRHYENGIVQRSTLSADLPAISLTDAERADLVAFLEALDVEGGPSLHVVPEPEAEAAGEPTATVEVSQRNKTFAPGHIAVRTGDVVRIHNDDTRTHNVRIFDPKLDYNSGTQRPGETVEIAVPEAGTYYAFCGIHPKMELVIEAE
jgi:cytochrome c peroxidase